MKYVRSDSIDRRITKVERKRIKAEYELAIRKDVIKNKKKELKKIYMEKRLFRWTEENQNLKKK